MIGIDVARMKRWYVKTFPDYSSTLYKIVVTDISQTAIDTEHQLDGVELNFTIKAYNNQTNAVVDTKLGRYSRRHYGGWEAYERSGS